jgi:sugar lactone lactonase YvrE
MTDRKRTFTAIGEERLILGESGLYDPRADRMFWLDIKGGKLVSSGTDGTDLTSCSLEGTVSAIGLAERSQFVCSRQDGFALLDIQEGRAQLAPLTDPEAHLPENRFNDGKVDPFGQFWSGTMKNAEDERTGSWYRLGPDGKAVKMLDGFFVTNGPAFDAEIGRGYVVDSADGKIFRFEINEDGITHYEEHLAFDTAKTGYPDGLTVDGEGGLWAAFWDGAAVRRFGRDGGLLEEIEVPAKRPTTVEIVGGRLFITTASIGLAPDEIQEDGKLLITDLDREIGRSGRFRFDDRNLV